MRHRVAVGDGEISGATAPVRWLVDGVELAPDYQWEAVMGRWSGVQVAK